MSGRQLLAVAGSVLLHTKGLSCARCCGGRSSCSPSWDSCLLGIWAFPRLVAWSGLNGPGLWLQESGRKRDLEESVQATRRRRAAQQPVIAQLADGRLTLLEAAARFRDIEADWPEHRARLATTCPGDSYEECLCRWAIRRVREAFPEDPARAAAVAARLEAELKGHLRAGTLRLPG